MIFSKLHSWVKQMANNNPAVESHSLFSPYRTILSTNVLFWQ